MMAKAYRVQLSKTRPWALRRMSKYSGQVVSLTPKPPVLNSQASLVLIYQPTEGMKNLAQRGVRSSDLWCGGEMHLPLNHWVKLIYLY
ncbi:hypothetical protein TNCV_3472691 [Trichonephila clavipes]|nr:hypothetical protein TNCV_3472691 [Trichonephila clavipes]